MIPLRLCAISLLPIAAAIGMSLVSAQTVLRGTVTVHITGPFGEELAGSTVQLLTEDRKVVNEMTGQGTFSNVLYDRYILRVRHPGARITERSILLDAPHLWVPMGLPFHYGDQLWVGGDLTIKGRISSFRSGGDKWWMRVSGVFLTERREGMIDSAGRFSIEGLEMGSYLLEVFQAGRLRHVEQVDIDAKHPETELSIVLSRTQP